MQNFFQLAPDANLGDGVNKKSVDKLMYDVKYDIAKLTAASDVMFMKVHGKAPRKVRDEIMVEKYKTP